MEENTSLPSGSSSEYVRVTGASSRVVGAAEGHEHLAVSFSSAAATNSMRNCATLLDSATRNPKVNPGQKKNKDVL